MKKRRLKVRRKAVVAKALEAIFKCFGFLELESAFTLILEKFVRILFWV